MNLKFFKKYYHEINVIDRYADEIDAGDKTHKNEFNEALDSILAKEKGTIKYLLGEQTRDSKLEELKAKYFKHNRFFIIGVIASIILYFAVVFIIKNSNLEISSPFLIFFGSSWVVVLAYIAMLPLLISINKTHTKIVVHLIRKYLEDYQ